MAFLFHATKHIFAHPTYLFAAGRCESKQHLACARASVCRVSECLVYFTGWYYMCILTPYTPLWRRSLRIKRASCWCKSWFRNLDLMLCRRTWNIFNRMLKVNITVLTISTGYKCEFLLRVNVHDITAFTMFTLYDTTFTICNVYRANLQVLTRSIQFIFYCKY